MNGDGSIALAAFAELDLLLPGLMHDLRRLIDSAFVQAQLRS